MTMDLFVDPPSIPKARKGVAKFAEGEVRLRIIKSCFSEDCDVHIASFDRVLDEKVRQVAGDEGIDYHCLGMVRRLHLTRFHCPSCGILPVYCLDLNHLNKVRCGRCSVIVSLKNSGKYGRVRKKVAVRTCEAIDGTLLSINRSLIPSTFTKIDD